MLLLGRGSWIEARRISRRNIVALNDRRARGSVLRRAIRIWIASIQLLLLLRLRGDADARICIAVRIGMCEKRILLWLHLLLLRLLSLLIVLLRERIRRLS